MDPSCRRRTAPHSTALLDRDVGGADNRAPALYFGLQDFTRGRGRTPLHHEAEILQLRRHGWVANNPANLGGDTLHNALRNSGRSEKHAPGACHEVVDPTLDDCW